MLRLLNEVAAVIGYFTVIIIGALALNGSIHMFGPGPLGRLLCIW